MNASILALRAITAATFQRLLTLVGLIGGGILILLIGLTIYLGAAIDRWWLLLLILLIPLTLVATGVVCVFYFLSNRLLPRRLSKTERKTIHAFTGTLLGLAEVRSTPWPVMVILIAKDVIRGKRSSYLETIVQNAGGLKGAFEQIRDFFQEHQANKND